MRTTCGMTTVFARRWESDWVSALSPVLAAGPAVSASRVNSVASHAASASHVASVASRAASASHVASVASRAASASHVALVASHEAVSPVAGPLN